MNTRLFTMIFMTAILSLTMVSAATLTIQNTNIPTSVNHNDGSFEITFELVNTGTASLVQFDGTPTTGQSTYSIADKTIADGSTTPVTETITATVNFNANQNGNLEGTIIATPASGSPVSFDYSVPISTSSSLSLTSATLSESQTDCQPV